MDYTIVCNVIKSNFVTSLKKVLNNKSKKQGEHIEFNRLIEMDVLRTVSEPMSLAFGISFEASYTSVECVENHQFDSSISL